MNNAQWCPCDGACHNGHTPTCSEACRDRSVIHALPVPPELGRKGDELMRSEAKVAALREALDFRASVEFDGGYHGGDLLRGIAFWMDKVDDERGSESREVQADLRRWAEAIDATLAATEGSEPSCPPSADVDAARSALDKAATLGIGYMDARDAFEAAIRAERLDVERLTSRLVAETWYDGAPDDWFDSETGQAMTTAMDAFAARLRARLVKDE